MITRKNSRENAVPDASQVEADQQFLLRPQQICPADGVVVEGTTTMDERTVTGLEAVEKYPHSRVYAGTHNEMHEIVVRATAVGTDTIQARKAALLQRIEALPEKKTGGVLQKLLGRGVSVKEKLLMLFSLGVYVSGEAAFSKLQTVDTIVFDKTGIITTGARHIEHVVSFKPYTQQQILNTAAAVESHSPHMAAAAIVHFAQAHGAAALQTATEVKDEGLGVSGVVSGKRVLVGPHALLERKKIKVPKETLVLKERGLTVVYVAVEKEIAGYLALSNPVKKNAKDVIASLKGHVRTVLFSGEHEETAAAIAKQTGMHEVVARVRDDNRDNKLQEIKDKERIAAYVTALHPKNKAEITITMGTRHAFEGDVTILHGNLSAIETLFLVVHEK